MDGAGTTTEASGTSAAPLLLIAAVAVGLLGQGAFYRGPHIASAVLVLTAWFVGRHSPAVSRSRGLLAGFAAMGTAAVVSGALDGHLAGAVGYVLDVAVLAAAVMTVAGCSADARRLLVDAATGLGAVVALAGWAGAVFRIQPLAHPDGGLWRAATTITYANASAAVLAMLALISIGRGVSSRRTRIVTFCLLTGAGVTLSRAGFGALALGALVVAVLAGGRHVWRVTGPAILGAAVAVAAALPGLPAGGLARPWLAGPGLVAGLVVASTVWRPRIAGPAIGLVPSAAAAVAFSGRWQAFSGRAGVASPDRSSLLRTAGAMWRAHWIAGVGPGRAIYLWFGPGGRGFVDHYAHDEYLQLATEQGVIGLFGLGALLIAVAYAVRRSGRRAPGAVGALVVFFAHSSLDFLWHVPVVPLVAALALGLVVPYPGTEVLNPPNQTGGEEVNASQHLDQGRPGRGRRRRHCGIDVRPAGSRPELAVVVDDHHGQHSHVVR